MAETFAERAARSIVTSLPPTDSIVDKMEWYTRIIADESGPEIKKLKAEITWRQDKIESLEESIACCDKQDTRQRKRLEAQVKAMRPVVEYIAACFLMEEGELSDQDDIVDDSVILQARAAQEKIREGKDD